MALPININELIHGSTVEWERIEYSEGSKSRQSSITPRKHCKFGKRFSKQFGEHK